MTIKIVYFLLLLAAILGWIFWVVNRSANQKVLSQCYDNINNLNAQVRELKREIERLMPAREFQSKWQHAPQLQEEAAEMVKAIHDFATNRLSDDIRSDIDKIGWGVYFDGSVDYSDRMSEANAAARAMVVSGRAVQSLNGQEVNIGAASCLLDAFDGYVRYYLDRPGAYSKRVQMVKMAYFLLNLRAKDSLHLSISKEYLDAQLKLLFIKESLDEQKRKKREQDREISAMEEKYASEDRRLSIELDRLRQKLERAHAAEKKQLEAQITTLQQQIEENKRAISNAQLTRKGTVYVLSNVGSFGENIYKIGMTRRTDPQERVKELGVASVPFPFDVQAFIATDDAPKLEHDLHEVFKNQKVNAAALHGREFFRVDIEEIRKQVEKLGYTHVRWDEVPSLESFRFSQSEKEKAISVTLDDLLSLLDEKGIKWIDKRAVGGCLWISSCPETDDLLTVSQFDGQQFIKAQKTKHFDGNAGWYIA